MPGPRAGRPAPPAHRATLPLRSPPRLREGPQRASPPWSLPAPFSFAPDGRRGRRRPTVPSGAERRPRGCGPPVCEPLQNKHSLLVCSIFCFFSCENHSTAKASGDGVSLAPQASVGLRGGGELYELATSGAGGRPAPQGVGQAAGSGRLGGPGPAVSCSARPVPPASPVPLLWLWPCGTPRDRQRPVSRLAPGSTCLGQGERESPLLPSGRRPASPESGRTQVGGEAPVTQLGVGPRSSFPLSTPAPCSRLQGNREHNLLV